ncbi:MAG: SPOR domain-containing protein [Pseudomonadota bacterium]
MANFEYYDDDSVYGTDDYDRMDDGRGGSNLGAAVNWVGALLSLGLVVGMGVWAFQLTMRDVSGVPVIRALEGPMRVPPADPGGVQAPHQGLAVNRIAEGSVAEAVPDRLVLAPPPVDLEALDLPEAPVEPEVAAATVPAAETDEAPATSDDTRALINRLIAEAVPLDEAGTAALDDTAAASVVAAAPDILPATVPGIVQSLRPQQRPAERQTASLSTGGTAAVAASAAPTEAAQELAAADLPAGTRLVQLGAYDTPEMARSEWTRLASRFPDFFTARARVIEQASSGGQNFYRLRAHGFEDLAASRRFCAALVAQGAACIPVTIR